MAHRTRIEPVPVPEWVLHWPQCSCGWQGYILRTQQMAEDQAEEHLAEAHPSAEVEQRGLFDA